MSKLANVFFLCCVLGELIKILKIDKNIIRIIHNRDANRDVRENPSWQPFLYHHITLGNYFKCIIIKVVWFHFNHFDFIWSKYFCTCTTSFWSKVTHICALVGISKSREWKGGTHQNSLNLIFLRWKLWIIHFSYSKLHFFCLYYYWQQWNAHIWCVDDWGGGRKTFW